MTLVVGDILLISVYCFQVMGMERTPTFRSFLLWWKENTMLYWHGLSSRRYKLCVCYSTCLPRCMSNS